VLIVGQAKKKAEWRKQFLSAHPLCCFCAGKRRADTIDHIPSRQLFRFKDRPPGLEVPACEECNKRTSLHEQVAALITRSYPNPQTPKDLKEVDSIAQAVRNNNPGLIEEVCATTAQQRRDTKSFFELKTFMTAKRETLLARC
jgi:hypothetical protein